MPLGLLDVFKRRPPATAAPGTWTVFEGKHGGRPLLARFNTGVEQHVGSAAYPIQIGVAIPFLAPNEAGMPTAEEAKQLSAFEDALVARAGQSALLVGAITTGGMREFVLYTGASEWLPAFHKDLKAAMPTHSVQMMAKTDPSWSVYRQFVRKPELH